MSSDRILFSKSPRKIGNFGKCLPSQCAPKSPRRSFWFFIPEACRCRRHGGGKETENGTCHESQFGQTLNGFFGMNKLAMSANHLFSAQRNLLDGPTVFVNRSDADRFKNNRGCQQPGCVKTRIINGVDVKGGVVSIRRTVR